jgi:DNA-binding MarR family transcriptional regulator
MPEKDEFLALFQNWIDLFMHRSMRRFLQYARKSGLSMSMIGTLFHLHQREKTGVTDLGDHLGVTSAAASQMLERLVQLGLIQRSEDPEDRRGKQIVLTDQGHQVLEKGLRARQDWLIDLVGELTEEERDQVSLALEILVNKAEGIK